MDILNSATVTAVVNYLDDIAGAEQPDLALLGVLSGPDLSH